MPNLNGAEEGLSVVVSLIDFHKNGSIMMNHHFDQLKIRMRTYPKRIPFSMKFEEVHQLVGPYECPFHCAIDAKISYSHNCICVADELFKIIVFFNLKTREYIKHFHSGEIRTCLVIEENFDGQNNDAIYYEEYESSCTVKYRIIDLLGENPKPIWRNTELHDDGMAIRMKNNQKQLFRFNSHKKIMSIMDTINGNIIGSFKLDNICNVSDIIFITPTKMIISDTKTRKCYIFEEVNGDETSTNEWKLIKKIEKVNGHYFTPCGMTIDRVGKRIFIIELPKRLIVIDYDDGNVLCTYNSTFKNCVRGLCFDERTGLLYITYKKCRSIRVFK